MIRGKAPTPIHHGGREQTVDAWAAEIGITPAALRYRLKKWCAKAMTEEAVFAPRTTPTDEQIADALCETASIAEAQTLLVARGWKVRSKAALRSLMRLRGITCERGEP